MPVYLRDFTRSGSLESQGSNKALWAHWPYWLTPCLVCVCMRTCITYANVLTLELAIKGKLEQILPRGKWKLPDAKPNSKSLPKTHADNCLPSICVCLLLCLQMHYILLINSPVTMSSRICGYRKWTDAWVIDIYRRWVPVSNSDLAVLQF